MRLLCLLAIAISSNIVLAQDSAQTLYRRFCTACHGDQGDGLGQAARYVFPKPRNFRSGKFRLISSTNLVASREDIRAVVENGIPGTAMPNFKKQPQADRELLIDYVLKLRKEGLQQSVRNHLLQEDDEVDEAELQTIVMRRVTASAKVTVPQPTAASKEAIARGKAIYEKQSCRSCHATDGRGILGQDLFDDRKFPTRARDFVVDELKSGDSPESMFLRIKLGMPGTPMPSSANLKPEEIRDLVHYCLSLGQVPKRKLTNHQRARLAAGVPIKKP